MSARSAYLRALREEPIFRVFLLASLVDDVGVALSTWSTSLLMTELATTQKERTSFVLPTLVCFLIGTLVSGPIADWRASEAPESLARWRWRVILTGRGIETAALFGFVYLLSSGPATIALVLPYQMIYAFMKTALRPTKIAFSVDILDREESRRDANGDPLLDEAQRPLRSKTHLLAATALVATFASAADLLGLVSGGRIMEAVSHRFWIPILLDGISNVGYLAIIFAGCKPKLGTGSGQGADPATKRSPARVRDALRFLIARRQRPLLALLAGMWIFEVVNESYDGKMIMKHVLHASEDGLRYAQIGWSVAAILGTALIPWLGRRFVGLGRGFAISMLIDGIVIAMSGMAASAGLKRPFAGLITADQALTSGATTLAHVAQYGATSGAMRGRIEAIFDMLAILGDMAAEQGAAWGEEAWGIPGTMVRVGLLQIAAVLAAVAIGGRRLWTMGSPKEATAE